ncbi:MAG: GNAT family N-acetyltransferase [Ferruginibacter sp.]
MHTVRHTTMIYKNFIIRTAGNEDIPSIKRIVFGVLKEYNLKSNESGKDIDLNNIELNYFDKGGYFGVAVETVSNEIVGTFGLYPITANVCELRKMYLLKDERGKGLGKFILRCAIEIAKEKQYSKIVLETISYLKEAISLYKQHGFKEVSPKEVNDRVDQAFELSLF